MDPRVLKCKTPAECETFAKNAKVRGHGELEREAIQRAIELRAEQYGAGSTAEIECLKAVYAYERALTHKSGKNVRASRTWQMISRHGIIPAVERVVTAREDAQGFSVLVEMGLMDFAFEAVVLKFPEKFSEEAVKKSEDRLHNRGGV